MNDSVGIGAKPDGIGTSSNLKLEATVKGLSISDPRRLPSCAEVAHPAALKVKAIIIAATTILTLVIIVANIKRGTEFLLSLYL